MSIPINPRNLQVYIVMGILLGSNTLYFSTSSGVTIDKIEAIEQRIERIEVAHGITSAAGVDHEKIFAHPGIFERTNQLQDVINGLEDRIKYMERLLIQENTTTP